MTRTRSAAAFGLAMLSVAGCAATNSSAVSSGPPPAAPAVAEPLSAAEQEFVNRLATIDPLLAEKPDRAANRGGNTCEDLDKDEATLLANTVYRFSGGDVQVSPAQALEIIEAARETVCAEAH